MCRPSSDPLRRPSACGGCRQLLRWGVPQHVLTSGGQLGEYLAGDLALRGQFQQVAADAEGVPAPWQAEGGSHHIQPL